jgi:hypothetical protein
VVRRALAAFLAIFKDSSRVAGRLIVASFERRDWVNLVGTETGPKPIRNSARGSKANPIASLT